MYISPNENKILFVRGRGEFMENYIAFFDLLGIKAIASYNNELYFENINTFQNVLKDCSNKLVGTKYAIRAFSDCAYIECDNIKKLFDYLIELRETLFMKEIFFNAAITKGNLESRPLTNNDNITCISFNSPETVKVYSMQNSFSGIGVYVDSDIFKSLDEPLRYKYIARSAYCIYDKDELYNKYESYYDLKYKNITPALMKFLLMNYIKTIALNKKASRYYLSAILTCINQLSYEALTKEYLNLFINNKLYITNKIITYDLLPIHLMLINRLYDAYIEIQENEGKNPNYSIDGDLNSIISISALKDGFDNLQFYSDKLLSKKNKYFLTAYVSIKMVEDI